MADQVQPFDRDQFIEAFKRGMDTTIEHLFDHIGGEGDGDRGGPQKKQAAKTTAKRGRLVFMVEVDPAAVAKKSDDQIRGFLESDAVDVMMDSFQKARALANAIQKAPSISRDGEVGGGCSEKSEGGHTSSECHVDVHWHFG